MSSIQPSLKPAEALRPEETLEVLMAYCTSVLNEDDYGVSLYRSAAAKIFRLRLPVTMQHFSAVEELIAPADCDAWTRSVLAGTLLPVKDALQHPDCPPSLLTRACHGFHVHYGRLATQHRNCPDEDAVYWVLQHRR